MDLKQLCMGCMTLVGEVEVCPNCGFVEGTPPEAPQHLAPRTLLNGRYLLGRVLGQGGFGITYLAWDINLDTKLAVKEYLPRDFASRSLEQTAVSVYSGENQTHFEYGLEKFLEEAKILAQFNNSPGIVSVRDFFRENNTAYLVMYYLDGITFKQYLEQMGGKIPYETAISIMNPVLDSLAEVHNLQLLHRDISPDNIYITTNRQVKLLDFGAARHSVNEQNRSLSIILKPGFAPEEQYRTKGRQGPWTDVYAAAATIYRAITGIVPVEALERMQEDTLVPPSQLGVNITADAEAALMQALSVRAPQRFQSIKSFQTALLGGAPVLSKAEPEQMTTVVSPQSHASDAPTMYMPSQVQAQMSQSPAQSYPPPAQAQPVVQAPAQSTVKSKKPLWVGLVAAVVVVALGIGAFLFFSPSDDSKVMKEYKGLDISEARKLLKDSGIRYEVEEEYDDDIDSGKVIRQKPSSGTELKSSDVVVLFVSLGKEKKKSNENSVKEAEPSATTPPSKESISPVESSQGQLAASDQYFVGFAGTLEKSNPYKYEAVDFDGDGVMELVTTSTDDANGSYLNVYIWDGSKFVIWYTFTVPDYVYDLTRSYRGGDREALYALTYSAIYELRIDEGNIPVVDKYEQDIHPYELAVGSLDGDDIEDFAFLQITEDGTNEYAVSFQLSNGSSNVLQRLGSIVSNLRLADLNGDGISEMLYFGSDNQVHILKWNGQQFDEVATTTFGEGNLFYNFYTADVDHDGTHEVVTISSMGDGLEGRYWKWIPEQNDLIFTKVFDLTGISYSAMPLLGDFDFDKYNDVLILDTEYDEETWDFKSTKYFIYRDGAVYSN
ncbi:MAG: protein kinase [Candidatus Cohnella colombiensis]|uniref:non-specific serine/threonine protein kinase n=1 Tax=Candidatus Cohnella colombiensis TaxID=3121368 RepID=A0AA95JEY9_9BACL|nr:MAG: protein kinase [Cohnella sp.]